MKMAADRYMTDATVWIFKDGQQIAEAVYHLRGGGGLSLMKWQGTAAKMDPVIDELLAGVDGGRGSSAARPNTSAAAADVPPAPDARGVDSMCDLHSVVDDAECRGELRFGMTTHGILAKLGRPDEISADGTVLRYGERYLALDANSRLTAISDSRPPSH